MFKMRCRSIQLIKKVLIAFARLRPRPPATLIEGENSLLKLPSYVKGMGVGSVLVVTDKGIAALGFLDGLLDGLRDAGITAEIYDRTVPNPTTGNIEEALVIYKENNCSGIIAVGGGSPLDCAKGVGARVARPESSIADLKGIMKVKKTLPPLFVVPTTAGTGSEATGAAVVTDVESHEKYALVDPVMRPPVIVLDPLLTMKLPPAITAQTGMDALCHAVEAYINRGSSKKAKKLATEAASLIFGNLAEACGGGADVAVRARMQRAAYLAGLSFARASLGNVHAMSHAVGGLYNTPHGLANAVILPHVLDAYGASAHKALTEMADAVDLAGLSRGARTGAKLSESTGALSSHEKYALTGEADKAGATRAQKAAAFIQAIRKLNEQIGMPQGLAAMKEEDIPLLAERAFREANPAYPVPRIFTRNDFAELYGKLLVT